MKNTNPPSQETPAEAIQAPEQRLNALEQELLDVKQTAAQLQAEADGLRARIRDQATALTQTKLELDWLRQHPGGRLALGVRQLSRLGGEARKNLATVIRYQRTRGVRACTRQVIKRLRNGATIRQKPPPAGVNPDRIVAHIDIPVESSLSASETVEIAGWACSSDGIDQVAVEVDGVVLRQIPITIHRPDVAAIYSDLPGSDRSGFVATVDIGELAPGLHDMTIVLNDLAGNSQRHLLSLTVMTPADLYHRLYMASRPQGHDLEALVQAVHCGSETHVFELWVDARGEGDLDVTIQSIADQQHEKWRVCIIGADPELQFPGIDPALTEMISLQDGFGNAGTVNAASPLMFLVAGETLAPDALLHFAAYFSQRANTGIVYSDHDCEAPTGVHQDPCFKPDWSPEHLLCRDYIGGIYAVRSAIHAVQALSLIDMQSPAWRYDLLLRLSEQTSSVGHLPKALWTQPLAADRAAMLTVAEQQIVSAALDRRGQDAEVISLSATTPSGDPIRRIRRNLAVTPKVSIIIPTTGRIDLLRPCVESLLRITTYPDLELIFLDNGRGKYPDGIDFLRQQGLAVIACDERFNWSRLNNIGAAASTGEVLLFLNDDIEIIAPDWLTELVSQVQEQDVGTVGSLLLYPDGLIQHAGTFLVDHGGGVRHTFQFQHPDHDLYQGWQHTSREVSASTGACLMLRREVYDELQGFDEDFVIAFGDISICLAARKRGYRNLWTPHCRLIHHESVSREGSNIGSDEIRAWNLYGDVFSTGDPYYNRNLVLDRMDCGVDLKALRQPAFVAPKRRERTGLNLIGYIRAEMGVAEGCRSLARAMDAVDFPFVVLNYEHGNPSRMGDQSWAHRIVDKPLYPVNVLHVNADVTPEAIENIGTSVFKGRYNIAYWAWELPEFPDYWSESFKYFDEIWVPSEFVRQAVAAKSPVPVTCVPHSVAKGPGPYLRRPYFDLPGDRFLFLSMYDTHSILERKNPEGTISAFRAAFAADDGSVGLILKVNNPTQDDRKELAQALGDAKNIFVIERTMARYEVDSLIHCCDCLVSLHRSEGFGLPIAEAMALGRAVITTPWSGNADFSNEHTAACVRYELVKIGRDRGPYQAHQWWADPDIDHAASLMRGLARNLPESRRLGQTARAATQELLAPEVIGKLIADRISALKS